MAKKPYQPPVQSKLGQTFDSLFLLALVLAALFIPLYLGLLVEEGVPRRDRRALQQ